jgi:hypothetical protein
VERADDAQTLTMPSRTEVSWCLIVSWIAVDSASLQVSQDVIISLSSCFRRVRCMHCRR